MWEGDFRGDLGVEAERRRVRRGVCPTRREADLVRPRCRSRRGIAAGCCCRRIPGFGFVGTDLRVAPNGRPRSGERAYDVVTRALETWQPSGLFSEARLLLVGWSPTSPYLASQGSRGAPRLVADAPSVARQKSCHTKQARRAGEQRAGNQGLCAPLTLLGGARKPWRSFWRAALVQMILVGSRGTRSVTPGVR